MKLITQAFFSVLVVGLAVTALSHAPMFALREAAPDASQLAAVELSGVEATPAATSDTAAAMPEATLPTPTFPPLTAKFAIGDTGAHVTQLQEMLAALGLYSGTVNGKYDAATVQAVKDFQTKYNLPVTPETAGLAGPGTRAKLNEVVGATAAVTSSSVAAPAAPPSTPASSGGTSPASPVLLDLFQPLLKLLQ
jgi:peptidoglycan hydrolase-like protein with peptidoglycan-binding domain